MKKTLVFLLLIALIAGQRTMLISPGPQTKEKNIGTCVKFTSDKESCLECVPHYHLFEGQCYIDIHGCSNYVFGNICRKCEAGFILVNNECCDKHCMSKIFKNYEQASEQSELTEDQKVERRITEGYEKTVESLTIFRYQFSKFVLVSTSNQVLQGYVRYFIKILANEKPYRCIADFETDTKKVFVLEFRPEADMTSIKQVVLTQQDVVKNEQARVALQYASGKFGLRTYGASLERVSVTVYKFGSEFKLIYIGTELVNIINVVVASGNKKQSPYSPWSQQRKDVKAIRDFVQKTGTIAKMKNTTQFELIKEKISETSNVKKTDVEIKTIEKVKQNTYKYTFVNEQTKQVFEEVTKIDPKTKKVEIIEHKEVISVDVKNMKLPESPERKIVAKDQITETVEIKETIKYLEEIQPSLATKEIVNAAVETIGENKKVTLIQKKNDQTSRVVVIHNERTGEKKLVDESPIVTTPPTQTIYTTTTEGKSKIITTDVETFKKNDEQVQKVISTIEQKFTNINTTNIVSLEKTEGNMVNTYQVVIKSEKPEQPQQQVTVVQNTQTKEVKVIDVEEIQRPPLIAPAPKKPISLPEIQFKSTEIKMIVEEYKKTVPEIKTTEEVVIKKVDVQESKFANQYTVVVENTKGQTMTIKANKPHDEKVVEITSVRPVVSKTEETKVVESSYVSKVTVDEFTGVKTVTTTKPEEIKTSFVTQVLSEVKSTKTEAKVEQIQSVVRQEYEKTVKETVVIKEQERLVQVTVEKNKQTGVVKKVSQQIVQIKVEQSKPILPVISSTTISETTFNQVVKVNQDLKKVTETVIESKPIYKDQAPITTEVQQQGSVQVVTMVYENKKTQQKERIVTEINQETKQTVIREQTVLPKVIEKITFEKDITKQGEVVLISNKIEEIKKEDTHITTVIQQVSEKIPIIKENSVRFEVVSNERTNTYQITAVDSQTKETVTVSVNYNKQTQKVTVNDIQQERKTEVISVKPQPKPIVILTPQEIERPQVQNVVHFVEKTVKVDEIKEIKETKSTLSTTYEVVTQTTEGQKTVVVIVDNSNIKDVTLIDVVSEVKKTEQTQVASYTSISVNSASVKDTTTNDQTVVSSNKYVTMVLEEAIKYRPSLRGQSVVCFSEDVFKSSVQVTFIVSVNKRNVLISGFVYTQTNKVELVSIPDQLESGLVASKYSSCSERSTQISTLTKETITVLSESSFEIQKLVSFVSSSFSFTVKDYERVIVEKFPHTIKYIIVVKTKTTTQRIVLIYQIRTISFTIIERPEQIKPASVTVLEQKTESDGTKVVTSNTIEQVKTVDSKVEKFMEVLSKQVQVDASQITNVVSKQSTNTNEYTLVVKSESTTSEIKAVFKKDDETVIITEVKEEPKPVIAPLVKPKTVISKEQYTSTSVTKVIESINENKKIPNITTEKIVEIVKTSTPITTSYEITTQTVKGKQTFVVTENTKGETTVIDYRPAVTEKVVEQSVKTEYVVNSVSGFETQVTNDVKIIKESVPIQSVVSKIVQEKTVSKNVEVVSAVTKTLEDKVQTTIVIKSPERPKENKVIVAVVDKKTEEVTIVAQKTVEVTEATQQVTVQEQVIETVYTTTVIAKTLKQDKKIQKIVNKVTEQNKQVTNVIPTQIITEKIGDKILSTVTYQDSKIVSTVVYDEKTEQATVISTQNVPQVIKPLVYETETYQGQTTIVTNSVEKVTQITENFSNIISEIKQSIPSIQTEKIEGIKIIKSETVDAPQKIVILFQNEKSTQKTQIAVIDEPKRDKITIVDVQSISTTEILTVPETVTSVKLSTQEIKEYKVESVIKENIKQIGIKQVKNVVDVHEVKTAYSTTLDIKVQDQKGQTYIIKTQQFGTQQPKIIDHVKVPEVKKPEIFTVISTNPKNGIVSTYTNDIKVMSEEKTFTRCIDYLEKQRNLTRIGFTIDSQTLSKLQRSVQHHIRFVNKQTKQAIDFRVLVDSRTGQITINEEEKITLSEDIPSTMPAQKSFLEIVLSQLEESMKRYTFIENALKVLAKADYTFENKKPALTQIKFYKGQSTNLVQVIMTFEMTTSGSSKKTRVVFIGQEKQPGKGYVMKIIDITTLPQVISSAETKVVFDEFNRKTTTTNDIKSLEKTSKQYVKVIDTIQSEITSLKTEEVSSVVVKQFKNVNQYTLMVKKGSEVLETKVTYDKTTQQAIISDLRTQSIKTQIEKVPIREIQSLVTQVTVDKFEKTTDSTTIKKQITEHESFTSHNVQIKSVTIEQNARVDTFIMKVVDERNVESTVTAIKNPTTQEITIVNVKEDKTTKVQEIRTKESTTEIKIDSVTGSEITITNDVKIIRQTPVIQNVIKKVVEEKTVAKQSEVVSAVTKTSENTIQSTVVIREPSKPTTQTVVVAMIDKVDTSKVEIISEETIEVTEQVETVVQEVVRQVVITKKTFTNVVKKDTHVQNIVKAVETKYTETKNQIPVQVVMQEVGGKTISELTYENKKITVISNEKQEVIKTYEQSIPKVINSGKVETTISVEGTKTTTSTNVDILTKVDVQFKQSLTQITKQVEKESIKTVVAEETSFGKVFTVVSQTKEEIEPKQTTYYYNKETKQVVNMGTEQISVINTVHQQVTQVQPQPVRVVSETKWTTNEEVKSVIQEVTNVVHQEKVTKVEEIKSAPTVKFYQVTVETEKGSEVVKVTVDKTTKQVQVIDKKTEVVTQQVIQPSQTTVVVNEVTGVKTTSTTDISVIKVDKTVQKVQEAIVSQHTQLKNTEIVSVVTKEYEEKIEEKVVFKSQGQLTQVVSVVDKKTDKVTIVEKSKVESIQQTTSDITISSSTLSEVISRDVILRRTIEFVGKKQPRFAVQPSNVNVEQMTTFTKFTFVYNVAMIKFRTVVSYIKSTDSFTFVEQPTEVQETKPIIFETIKTEQGRVNYFTNDVQTLTKFDTNFNTMFSQVTKDVKISTSDITSVQTTQTSTGTSYTIVSTQGTEQNQMSVIYNEKTKEVKIVDLETVREPALIAPTPRPSQLVSKEEYTSDDITLITDKSVQELKIVRFTSTQITKVEKSKTTFGVTYILQVDTDSGKSYITATVGTDRIVTIVNYKAPVLTKPALIAEAPSTTQFSVDSVTGTQVQTTNDVKVIKQSSTVQNVVKQLVKSSTITQESQIVSSTTKTTADTIQTTMVVKSETQNKVVVSVTDKKTNQVKVIAEKHITKEEVKKVVEQQVQVTQIVPQTVISSTIYEEVVKKDVTLQNVVKEVRNNHPEIKETIPTKVVVEKFGEKTVTEVSFKDTSYTVVTDTKTNVVEQVVTSTLFKETERKAVVLEQRVTEEGTKVITSNKVEHIEKVVPTVRPAITEVIKVVPSIKTEQIKTIKVEEKQFTVITVDESNKVKEVTFTYEPEKPKPIRLIDLQQFTEPVVVTKPKEIVFQPVVIEQRPEIIKAIEKVNKTSSVIKNDVTQIVKVEKAVTNFVEEYKVQVKTHTKEEATIVFEVNQQTKQFSVVDVMKYEPQVEKPKEVIVQETIDVVTQTRQTVFPTVETYKKDETYEKVVQHLQTEITKGYQIVSVTKQNYGENQQLNILLKSEETSPQQVQLNINTFNNEITVLQNKTIVSSETQQFEIISKEQPKPIELKLNPVDQEKFEIISKLNVVKQQEGFSTLSEVKTLEKNELFKKADTYLKSQFEPILQQSNIVHVTTKQTLDSEEYKVYYVNTENNDKQVYEAKVKINPITQTFEVADFTKIGGTQPEKSNLNVGADIAYGYEPLNDFSNNKNIQFVVQEAKKHYSTLSNAVIQSVEVLALCNGRFNYKIFFKNGLEVVKYIIYFEETFKRVIFLEGKQFSFGGASFETLSKDVLVSEGYFKNVNQYVKEKNTQVAEGSEIINVQREDEGRQFTYRIIYRKDGKTYIISCKIDKDTLVVTCEPLNMILQVPAVQQVIAPASSEQYATLRISDLAHNSNFEKVHREILSKEGSFLQNAQLIGAQQQSDMFKVWFKFYFFSKQDYYKIEAEIDSTNKKVKILTDLEKVNKEAGFTTETNSDSSRDIINWAQKINPDLKSGAVMEVSSKRQIFGQMYKVVIKMPTKFYIMTVYKEGNDLKMLSQNESTTMDSMSPSVRSFPRPGRAQDKMTLNNA